MILFFNKKNNMKELYNLINISNNRSINSIKFFQEIVYKQLYNKCVNIFVNGYRQEKNMYEYIIKLIERDDPLIAMAAFYLYHCPDNDGNISNKWKIYDHSIDRFKSGIYYMKMKDCLCDKCICIATRRVKICIYFYGDRFYCINILKDTISANIEYNSDTYKIRLKEYFTNFSGRSNIYKWAFPDNPQKSCHLDKDGYDIKDDCYFTQRLLIACTEMYGIFSSVIR